jgi:hypothetical protein
MGRETGASLANDQWVLMEFTMDARRAPERIFQVHLLDQRTKVRVDPGPPSPRTGLPQRQ